MNKYGSHKIAGLFPMLPPEELDALAADIKANGLRDPIWLYEGLILDGRNRDAACRKAGVEVRTRDFNGTRSEAVEFVWSVNVKRRHLNPGQLACAAVKRAELDAEYAAAIEAQRAAAAERQTATLRKGDKTPVQAKLPERKNPATPDARQSRTIIAKAAGTSPTYMRQAAELRKKTPEAFERVERGEVSLGRAIQDVKRVEVVAKLEAISTKEAKKIEGVYDVIVVDPPWPMEKIERDERPNQSGLDYPTMNEAQLSALRVPAAADCHVWVWTTHKFLPTALRLIDRWSFKYVCTFVWHKPGGFQPFGLPQYNCEFALYCRKGNPQFIDTKSLPVCFSAPRGAHSEKPELFYDTLRRVTAGRRLDMFNRREISGFDRWGNEADK